MSPRPIPIDDAHTARYLAMVNVAGDDECWLWTGGCDKYGYGAFWISTIEDYRTGGTDKRGYTVKAQRYGYKLAFGKDPEHEAAHHCDVPACQNPRHLYDGTHQENMDDRTERGRWAGGRPLGRGV